MRVLVDDQLPIALARWINTQNVLAVHLADAGLTGRADRDIWSYAKREEFVIVTLDSDFSELHKLEPAGPQVVWVRWGNLRKPDLLLRFARAWPDTVSLLLSGRRLVELR